jgi:hypothetical protein
MGTTNDFVGVGSSPRSAWGLTAPISAVSTNPRGWIQSPLFDLSLFTLSPLAGLLIVIPALMSPKGIQIWIAATYLIAIPHYVSSFSFYLGDANLDYYRTRRMAFFVGPVLIFITVMALRLTKIDAAVPYTLYVWNVYHVSMQSA